MNKRKASEFVIEKAGAHDVAGICVLVNKSFRGPASRQGWTNESDYFAEGGKRIDEKLLSTMMSDPDATIFKLTEKSSGKIFGCVYLKNEKPKMYLGMLSVDPSTQSGGIGSIILRYSENFARTEGCHIMYMKVLSIRAELIAWYERAGYRRVGDLVPYDPSKSLSRPTRELAFAFLEKEIG